MFLVSLHLKHLHAQETLLQIETVTFVYGYVSTLAKGYNSR
jgi:hypothetical protein